MKRAFTSLSCCCFHHPGASIPHRGSLLRRGSHWMFQWSSTSTQSSRSLEQEGTDKYLEVSEGDRVQHSLKEKIRKEYYPRIRMVLKSELNSPTKLGVPVLPPAEDGANNSYARRTKAKAKLQGCQQLRSKWVSKALHGKYPQRVKQDKVDHDKTHRWLKAAGLKAETRGLCHRGSRSKPPNTLVHTLSSRSLTWNQIVDCVDISTRPFPAWSLAPMNWLKLTISTATTRQLHTCTGRSAKLLALR